MFFQNSDDFLIATLIQIPSWAFLKLSILLGKVLDLGGFNSITKFGKFSATGTPTIDLFKYYKDNFMSLIRQYALLLTLATSFALSNNLFAQEAAPLDSSISVNEAAAEVPQDREERASTSAIGLKFGPSFGSGKLIFKSQNTLKEFDGEKLSGISLSVPVELKLAPYVYFQPELNYVQKGFTFTGANDTRFSIKFSYLEVPLLLKLKAESESVKPFILGGLALSQRVSSTYKIETKTTTREGDVNDENFVMFSTSAIVGAGAELNISSNASFVVEARYNRGLTNQVSNKVPEGNSVKFHAIQAMAGMMVSL